MNQQIDKPANPEEQTFAEKIEHAKAQVDAGAQPTLEGMEPEKPEADAKIDRPSRLGLVIRKFRVIMEITPRDLADQIGITTRELVALEAGKECGSVVLTKTLAWMLGAS